MWPTRRVADGRAALDAAVAAQRGWASTAPRERGEILRAAYERITERADEFALLMTLEMGKPLAESRGEVAYGAEFFRWFSEEAVRVHGQWATSPDGATRLMTMKQPVGPALMITPVELPARHGHPQDRPGDRRRLHDGRQAGPADPADHARCWPQVLQECGLPDGVLNVVTTSHTGEVCEPLIRDPRLRKLTFTGRPRSAGSWSSSPPSSCCGSRWSSAATPRSSSSRTPTSTGAVDGAMLAKMRNIGEACTAANRFYVHESVAEEFSRKFAARMARLTIGKGTAGRVTVGPLIDAKAVAKVTELRRRRRREGRPRASPAVQPQRGRGYFFQPTVLADVPAERPAAAGGDLRPGRAGDDVPDEAEARADGQRHRVRAGRATSSPPT